MPLETCEYHLTMATDIATIKADINYIKENFCRHIVEAEGKGGRREQLEIALNKIDNLNKEIAVIKKGYWKACFVSGLIGALLGHLTPDLFKLLVTFFKIHLGIS